MRIVLILPALLCAALAHAAEPPVPASDNFFKRLGRQLAQDAKSGWNQAGKAYGDTGRSIGRGAVDTSKQLGKEIKDSSRRTVKAAKDTFQEPGAAR